MRKFQYKKKLWIQKKKWISDKCSISSYSIVIIQFKTLLCTSRRCEKRNPVGHQKSHYRGRGNILDPHGK